MDIDSDIGGFVNIDDVKAASEYLKFVKSESSLDSKSQASMIAEELLDFLNRLDEEKDSIDEISHERNI